MSWQIDPIHTQISFSVRHMMIRKVRGFFKEFSGTMEFDEENPAKTTINMTIEMASIETRDKQRNAYLRSASFLNTTKYPNMTFASKRVEQINRRNGRLIGNLIIMDVSHEVILNVRRIDRSRSRDGHTSARFKATTSISRKDWGLEWNAAMEAGGWLVGDKISVDITLGIIPVPEP